MRCYSSILVGKFYFRLNGDKVISPPPAIITNPRIMMARAVKYSEFSMTESNSKIEYERRKAPSKIATIPTIFILRTILNAIDQILSKLLIVKKIIQFQSKHFDHVNGLSQYVFFILKSAQKTIHTVFLFTSIILSSTK